MLMALLSFFLLYPHIICYISPQLRHNHNVTELWSQRDGENQLLEAWFEVAEEEEERTINPSIIISLLPLFFLSLPLSSHLLSQER